MSDSFTKRFNELANELNAIIATKQMVCTMFDTNEMEVDHGRSLQWKVNAKALIDKTCGTDSAYVAEFTKQENGAYSTTLAMLQNIGRVFLAAKADYEGGYLRSQKSLIQADLFGSELEQAQSLLDAGYTTSAAVVAGVVLETTLRELCDKAGIAHGKADKMNADLAKAGVYNGLKQKQITAHLAVRNSAAHGKEEEFTKDDVKAMIPDVERFVADYL